MNDTLSCLRMCLAAVLACSTALHAAESPGPELLNHNFTGEVGGVPDSWTPYPPASGGNQALAIETSGGVRFTDQDKHVGLGLAQWVAVTPGQHVSAHLEVEGEGTISLSLIFTPKIPAKAAMIEQMAIRKETAYFSETRQDNVDVTVPDGARFMRVVVYCTKPGLCDLVVKSLALKISEGTEAAPPSSTPAPAASAPAPLTSAPELKNPTFSGVAGDIPDGWQTYPPPTGDQQKLGVEADGGVRFTDQDAENGLGLAQWVPVTPGEKISASLTVDGPDALSLTLTFAAKIPAKINMLKTTHLGEAMKFFSGSKQDPIVVNVPEGAQFMRVVVYSTKPGLIDVVVKSVDIKPAAADEVASPMKPAAAAPAPTPSNVVWATDAAGNAVRKAFHDAPESLPEGTVYAIDFESGDYSQCRSLEGGKKWIGGTPDPVRNGKYALKTKMTHDQHRSEITGPRSGPSGEFKYGWSLFLPENFDGETHFSIVTQWHNWGSGKEYPPDGGPPTSITISNNTWSMKIQHQEGEELKTAKEVLTFGSIEEDKGKWTDFYMEVNWQSPKAGGGYLRLWKNGVQVINYTGPTWFDGQTKGPYFKMGAYKGGGSWKGEEDRTILFFDEFRMGDKSSTREQIDPALQPRA